MNKRLVVLWILTSALLVGCRCSKEEAPALKGPESTPGKNTAPASSDSGTLAMLEKVAANCEVDLKRAVIRKCKGDEKRTLVVEFARGKRDRLQALEDFGIALNSKDEKLRTVAANVLHSSFRTSVGDANAGSLSSAPAQKLLAAIPNLNPRQAARALPAVVHAAILAGLSDQLFALLDAPGKEDLAAVGYRHVLTYGGQGVFEQVKKAVASKNARVAIGALDGLQQYTAASEEQKVAACDVARVAFNDERPPVAGKAATILLHCEGDYADGIIKEGRKRATDGSLDIAFSRAFSGACTTTRVDTPGNLTTKQCQAVRKFHEDALANEKLGTPLKILLLTELVRQWPDTEAEALLSKLSRSKDKQLAARAKDAQIRLDRAEDEQKKAAAGKAEPARKVVAPSKPASAAGAPSTAPKTP